jgi:hypothetical protein
MKVQTKFTAEFIYRWLQQLPSPADAAATLAMVQCALIMGQNPPDEETVRERMAATTEGVVDMWKQQVSQQSETRQ